MSPYEIRKREAKEKRKEGVRKLLQKRIDEGKKDYYIQELSWDSGIPRATLER